jgi:hypothetical protein
MENGERTVRSVVSSGGIDPVAASVGTARASADSRSGARGRSPGTAGCGIVAGSGAEGDVTDGGAVLGAASGLAVHATTGDAAATITKANGSRRTSLLGLFVPRLIRSFSASSGQRAWPG